MKWRVVLELIGPDGTVDVREVGGGAAVAEYAPRMIGLTLAEEKRMLAAVQRHLVRAQTEDHCRHRRRCQRCGAQQPLKDQRWLPSQRQCLPAPGAAVSNRARIACPRGGPHSMRRGEKFVGWGSAFGDQKS
jgi:hypothetical protein